MKLISNLLSKANGFPNSAAEFQKLFSEIDDKQWGAADVSISVPLQDGRSAWLYGDTFSGSNGFVHSTAIVQNGWNLHVSNGGKQLLPNDSDNEIYWIEKADEVAPNILNIVAAPMQLGDGGVWDFHRRNEKSRVAEARILDSGDINFVKWVGYVPAPPQHQDFKVVGPNHFTYAEELHPQFPLKSGKTLATICQNWDDDFSNHFINGKLRYEDFRPIFLER